MTLDSSVMNVSIEEVAKDVGTTVTGIQSAITLLHVGHGRPDDHRGQDRSDHRPEAGVRDRVRDLRLRIADDRARAELRHAADRLVVPRGRRRGADPARDRRARRRQLRTGAPPRCVRARRSRGSDRRRRRAVDRRLLHDLLLVALRLRRRGPDRARDPPGDAPHRRRPEREAPEARLCRFRPLRRRALADRLRHPQVRHLGLDPAEGGRPVLGRSLADGLARPRGTARRVGVLPLGGPRARRRARSRSSARRCSATVS